MPSKIQDRLRPYSGAQQNEQESPQTNRLRSRKNIKASSSEVASGSR